ncbi:MarR family winged helix-turn-helix transcriptional regulator [Musicola keenii]|uniref:MarR family winged helix-turn-helix transcriptional regulator n=1 Tax=Musicola keenii TaxID=2884250 RepID=UPI00178660F7|nr:MarR family transcriptional regulator [Musicola keenii]
MQDTLDTQTFELLGELIHRFKRHLQDTEVLAQAGMAPFQARALSLIARHPGQSQHFLVQHTGRDKAQIARLLKDLETLGLITRRPSPTDRRVQCVALTERGEAIHHRFSAARTAMLQQAFSDVTPEERRSLLQIMQKMKANLDNAAPHDRG